MFTFAQPRKIRRPSLTPMIDVVFLLLVFFMLAARYGQDIMVPLVTSGGMTEYQGPPRLVQIAPESILLNGISVSPDALPDAVSKLMTNSGQAIILQPLLGANLQRLLDVIDILAANGMTNVTVVPSE